MLMSRHGSGRAKLAPAAGYLIGALMAASIGLSTAHAATFGHSRIVSGLGQPLHVEIPVTELTGPEIESLRAVPAPASAWQEAGMTPPVPLDSMRLVLLDGYRPGVKVIQLRSDQVFDQPIVDVLLDIRTASGQQRYQVSLLAHADSSEIQRPGTEASRNPRPVDGRQAAAISSHPTAGIQIAVRRGDTMFSLAQRHAVQGVTVYQMMIALQRANRHAFIEDNVNLVKAGETLIMPDMDALTALSDREARRIFQQHAQAFARYRQRSATAEVATLSGPVAAVAQGEVSDVPSPGEGAAVVSPPGGDMLRLSGGSEGASTRVPDVTQAGGSLALAEGTGANPSQAGNASIAGGTGSGPASAGASGDGSTTAAAGNGSAAGQAGTAAVSGGAAGNAPMSMLAASGAIASDASPGGSKGASTPSGAGRSDGSTADDQAAVRKGMEESRTRILELEDNVRHLNEALQKQGQVAAEAAMEGARSVSETIREALGLSEEDDAGTASSGTESPEASGSEAAGASGSGVPAASGGAAGSGAGILGGSSRSGRGAGVTPGSLGDVGGALESSSGKAGKKVSWLQENLFVIMAGGLALIVLIVVWVLRRAGRSSRDAFESDSPITETMVREKLREIDLDLDSPSPDAGRRGA